MSEITKCPKCGGEYVYFDGSLYVCPDCAYEFDGESGATTASDETPRDSNGAELMDGDAVTVIKDLTQCLFRRSSNQCSMARLF